jgi:hypothetical protein
MVERSMPNAANEEATWLVDARFAPLFDEILAAVVKQYRIDADAARELLAACLAGSKLGGVVESAASAADIRRTRIFKDAAASAKRHVYHALRQYQRDANEDHESLIARLAVVDASSNSAEVSNIVRQLVDNHVSTRERLPSESEFYRFLVEQLKHVTTILDVGCGIQPLRFPFASLDALRCYAAVDSNERSVATVAAFAAATKNVTLRPIRNDLTTGWDSIVAATLGVTESAQPTIPVNQSVPEFDAAFMLKLIPVIARQSRALLPLLAQTPARRWIVTGSTTGLAKRTSIQRREQGVLKRFIADSGREIREEFTFGEEFGYVVE